MDQIVQDTEAQLRELHRLLPDWVAFSLKQEIYRFKLPDGSSFTVSLAVLRHPYANMLDHLLDGLHNALCRLLPTVLPTYVLHVFYDQGEWCADLSPLKAESVAGQQHFSGASPFMGLALARAMTFTLRSQPSVNHDSTS